MLVTLIYTHIEIRALSSLDGEQRYRKCMHGIIINTSRFLSPCVFSGVVSVTEQPSDATNKHSYKMRKVEAETEAQIASLHGENASWRQAIQL